MYSYSYSVPSSVSSASLFVCAIPFGYAAALFLLLALLFGILAICKRKKGLCITGIIMSALEIVFTLLWKFVPLRILGVSINDFAGNWLTIVIIVLGVLGLLCLVLSILGMVLKKNKAPKAPKPEAPAAPAEPVAQPTYPQAPYVQAPVQPVQPVMPQQPVYQPVPQQPVYQPPVMQPATMGLSPEKAAELKKLDDMLANHVITREEYEATKKWMLG